jgi:hypothetical protein
MIKGGATIMASARVMGRDGATMEVLGSDGSSLRGTSLAGTDPLGFAAGDANLYRYVGNDPASATDPTGLIERFPPPSKPDVGEFLRTDPDVWDSWLKSLKTDKNGDKHEEGGWIYFNPDNGSLRVKIAPPERHKDRNNSIDLSNPPAPDPGWQLVGYFHTHPYYNRPPGPSSNDRGNQEKRQCPGYVIHKFDRPNNKGGLKPTDVIPYGPGGVPPQPPYGPSGFPTGPVLNTAVP